MARDTEKWQRIVEWRRKTREAKLGNAQAEADNVDEEMAECQAAIAKAERRMKAVEDDKEYTMWREEWKRQTNLMGQLEKRQKRADSTVTIRLANLERLKALKAKWAGLLSQQPGGTEVTPLHRQILGQLADAALQQQDPLASLSIEEKREVMRLLGVHVLMYPTDSDFVRQHDGKRYEVRCNEDADSVTDYR
jgi:hypothetical protein